MSVKEIERIKILHQVRSKTITQVLAAKMLNISERHVRRLLSEIKENGDQSIISKKRGKRSNRSLPETLRSTALEIISNYYADFGPTLACEYLQKYHQICVSSETIRLWMSDCHLWIPRQKQKKLHPPRERRRAFGELIQIDGSHHPWFEDRAPSCVLMVFVDDATSTITSMHFSKSESLEAYLKTLEKHLKTYGIPLSLYGDRCSVLTPRNNSDNRYRTAFQKVLNELNCSLILALSPQAKGKVERANRTLQDRLVKELRLNGISSIEEANIFLECFRKEYNLLFSKKPGEQMDAHRSLEGICLEHVLCAREERTLLKNHVVQFRNTFYQISSQTVRLYKGKKIEFRDLLDGGTKAFCDGIQVTMTPIQEIEQHVVDEKEYKVIREYKTPRNDHPYKINLFRNKTKENMLRNAV